MPKNEVTPETILHMNLDITADEWATLQAACEMSRTVIKEELGKDKDAQGALDALNSAQGKLMKGAIKALIHQHAKGEL